MATSTLLDKLPPEARVAIYSYTFGPSKVIKLSTSEKGCSLGIPRDPNSHYYRLEQPQVSIKTSILATNKFVHKEAIEVLYRDKTIRATTSDFNEILQLEDFVENVRHVEIADCHGSYAEDGDAFRSVLRRLQTLPAVRTLVILSDCLGYIEEGQWKHNVSPEMTVPEFCAVADLGHPACTNVGRYQLQGSFGRYEFANRRLVTMWPEVETTPAGYDACKKLDSLMKRWRQWEPQDDDHNTAAWVLQTSLRCWVGMYDMLVSTALSEALGKLRDSDKPSETDTFHLLNIFASTTRTLELDLVYDLTDLTAGDTEDWKSKNFSLRNLGPKDGHEILSWATEFLALNVSSYQKRELELDGSRSYDTTPSYWAQTDGGMDTIEYRSKHQHLARTGTNNFLYMRDPTRSEIVIDVSSTSKWIWNTPVVELLPAKQRDDLVPVSLEEREQLAYLSLALSTSNHSHAISDEHQDELDGWSAGLLQRYILASGWFHQEATAILNTPLNDLRIVIQAAIQILEDDGGQHAETVRAISCLYPVSERPPQDLDSGLYSSFAWKHGPLLGYIWQRVRNRRLAAAQASGDDGHNDDGDNDDGDNDDEDNDDEDNDDEDHDNEDNDDDDNDDDD